jgi:hypothetical protein
MMQQALKLRSHSGRKLTTGLRWCISQNINPASPMIKSVNNVCTRPKGSPSQSHSCPLLSITSQQTMVMTRSDKPIESKRDACLLPRTLCREIVRVMDHGMAGSQGQKADWEVDVEVPTP